MLELSITKQMGNFKLQIDLSLREEIALLFGPSGAGKSLTLNAIAGIIRPDEGLIRVDGQTYFDSKLGIDLPMRQRRIGYVFQENSLFPHLTVFENIAYGIRHLPEDEIRREVERMLSLLSIEGLSERYPHQISGGQSQRVAIARTLVTKPALLLLDEPFGSLDYPVRAKLRQDLIAIHQTFPGTILFVTHDAEEAFILGDVIAVIDEGRLIQTGSREEVFYHPRTRKVAEFFGFKNIFRGEVVESEPEGMVVQTEHLRLTLNLPEGLRVGDKITCAIRPEEIKILREDRPVREDLLDNIFPARVVEVVNRGVDYSLGLEVEGHPVFLTLHAPNYAYRDLKLGLGKVIKVCLRKEAFWIIPDED